MVPRSPRPGERERYAKQRVAVVSSANERLTEVFDRGCRDGIDVLSVGERDWYAIQEFILDYEMGGLSGYLYNHLPDIHQIRTVISAMRKRQLTTLAAFLEEATELFADYHEQDSQTTWASVLMVHDPNDLLSLIDSRIASLDDYELNAAQIA